MRDETKAVGLFTAGWFYVVLLVIATSAIGWYVYPYFVGQETKVIRASNAYITTQQTALNDFKAEYDRLEVRKAQLKADDPAKNAEMIQAIEGQQVGITNQMKQRATLIPDNVPSDIRAFLSGR